MNVSFLKIRSAGLPHFCIRMQAFNLRPDCLPDALALDTDFHKQKIKMIMLRLLVYHNDRSADNFIANHSSISNRAVCVERTINICFGKYLHIGLAVFCFRTELKGSLHLFFEFR